MSDPQVLQPTPADPAFDLAKKRAAAQLAMEGEERRKRRETEEKFHKEKELLEARKTAEKLRSQGEIARLEAENLKRVQSLREERHQLADEEKHATEEVALSRDVSLSPLRTLKFDMNNLMRNKKTSLVSMAIKEDERRRVSEAGVIQEKKKSYLLTGFSLLFFALGLGALGWWGYDVYRARQIATIPNRAETVDSFVFAEQYKDVVVADENAITLVDKLRQDVKNNNIKIGAIQYDRFVDIETGLIRVLTTSEWLSKINSSIPDSLSRLLDDAFMYGIFSGAQNSGFVIMKTSYYEKAFAGMLAWEASLARDMYSIFSGRAVTRYLQNAKFTDVSVKNIGARVLKDSDGTTAMVYAFMPDKTTIVMAHSEPTIIEILSRITTPKPQTSK